MSSERHNTETTISLQYNYKPVMLKYTIRTVSNWKWKVPWVVIRTQCYTLQNCLKIKTEYLNNWLRSRLQHNKIYQTIISPVLLYGAVVTSMNAKKNKIEDFEKQQKWESWGGSRVRHLGTERVIERSMKSGEIWKWKTLYARMKEIIWSIWWTWKCPGKRKSKNEVDG